MAEAEAEVFLDVDVEGGPSLSIPLEYYDCIGYLKQKVQQKYRIPTSQQTFYLDGRLLEDDFDIYECHIYNGTHLQLVVAPDSDQVLPQPGEQIAASASARAALVSGEQANPSASAAAVPGLLPTEEEVLPEGTVLVKLTAFKRNLQVEMKLDDAVLKLKEKIHEMDESIKVERIVLLHPNDFKKCADNKLLRESGIITTEQNGLSILYAYVHWGGEGPENLQVMVSNKEGMHKVQVQVKASNKVLSLRNALEKLSLPDNFLPRNGPPYLFNYKKALMNESLPFVWHQVQEGDTIHIVQSATSSQSHASK